MNNGDNILLGTSGWSYKEWEGSFYRKGEKHKLRAYSRIFTTVEIDSTWYRYPSKGTVMGWLRYSPPNFTFTAKLPKVITHEKKLGIVDDVQADLEAFLKLMQPLQLNGKLGCLLIQLPPSYGYNPENLESFLRLLSPQFNFATAAATRSAAAMISLSETANDRRICSRSPNPSPLTVTTWAWLMRYSDTSRGIWIGLSLAPLSDGLTMRPNSPLTFRNAYSAPPGFRHERYGIWQKFSTISRLRRL